MFGSWIALAMLWCSPIVVPLTSAYQQHHDYCVIGAGPAGLQMGYFLSQAKRDYIIFEKSNHSGAFFSVYPKHRRLISINKRFTGKTNPEFNMRHDWNSLISHDESLLFKHFSDDFFPEADTMVHYLNTFTSRLGLHVRYNTRVRDVQRHPGAARGKFSMVDQHNNKYTCRYVIVATGLSTANQPVFPGSQLVEGYEDVDVRPDAYRGKNVLILGRGNAAFETADAIHGSSNMVHMLSRSRARLAWNTHYVGDLRAVNNNLLDTYQLKSLDGLLERAVEDMALERRKDGRIYVHFPDLEEEQPDEDGFDNFSLREGYDHVIRCLGFKFDFSIFSNSSKPSRARREKFPGIQRTYESREVPGLYFAGTIAHSLDFRESAGGFIHGFRYSVRTLHRLLEWRNEGRAWPTTTHPVHDLVSVVVRRVNEASGPYQMYGQLGDVILLKDDGRHFEILEEFPIHLLADLEAMTGREASGPLVVWLMEYGPDFSGPGKDTFRVDRSVGDPLEAHRSNFLHPVLYYYKRLPSEGDMLHKMKKSPLPRPDRLHHVLEDFLTDWTAQQSHILPLRRFLEYATGQDLRHHDAHECLVYSLVHGVPPPLCPGGRVGGWSVHLTEPVNVASLGEVVSKTWNYTLWSTSPDPLTGVVS